ncbi:MAG: hypothetical protein WC975_13685 [Phycisphaerae bacterium]
MSEIKIGMSSGSLAGTFNARLETHDPLEAVVCIFDAGQEITALVILDLTQLSVAFCRELRTQLSKRTGLTPQTLWIHCTHTHTAPSENEFLARGMDGLVDQLSDLLQKALVCVQPAKAAYHQIDTGRQFNMNRRKYLAEVHGAMTVWMGCRNYNGSPDACWLNRSRLAYWRGRGLTHSGFPTSILYDEATDGWVQGISFKDIDGKPIGSLIRYAAHPCIAGHTTRRKYSADFPGVVRRIVRERQGGICGYLSGPCGNLAPWEQGDWPDPDFPQEEFIPNVPWVPHRDPQACWGEVERIGRGIAEAILNSPSEQDYATLNSLSYKTVPVLLPIRPDLLADSQQALDLAQKRTAEFLIDRPHLDLPEIKKRVDEIYFLRCHQAGYEEFHYLTSEEYQKKQIEVELPVLRLNDMVFLGLPGEVFWQTVLLAAATAQNRNLRLISLTESNGDIGYIPTEDERPGGDYECCNSIMAQGAEATLADIAQTIIRKI